MTQEEPIERLVAGNLKEIDGRLYSDAGGDAVDALVVAILTATSLHMKQTDKQGMPYILHPLRVMERVRPRGQTCMIKAVLHDVVEDCGMRPGVLARMWSPEIAATIDVLSRLDGEDYFDYIRRIRDSGDEDAIAVKLADLDDNSDPTRGFDGFVSLIRSYERARRILLKERKHELRD